jgi:hypothetical protein
MGPEAIPLNDPDFESEDTTGGSSSGNGALKFTPTKTVRSIFSTPQQIHPEPRVEGERV